MLLDFFIKGPPDWPEFVVFAKKGDLLPTRAKRLKFSARRLFRFGSEGVANSWLDRNVYTALDALVLAQVNLHPCPIGK
jgi:hypothetical protein